MATVSTYSIFLLLSNLLSNRLYYFNVRFFEKYEQCVHTRGTHMNNTKNLRHALCVMVLLGVVKQALSMHSSFEEPTDMCASGLKSNAQLLERADKKYKRDMAESERKDQLHVEKITKEVDAKWGRMSEKEQLKKEQLELDKMSQEERLVNFLAAANSSNNGDGEQDKKNEKKRGYNEFFIKHIKDKNSKK